MIYVASPYSRNDLDGDQAPSFYMTLRYEQTRDYVAKLLQEKKWCYSPIVHCHDLANTHKLPTDAEFWWSYNKHFIDRADVIHVLKLHNWKGSVGVAKEIAYAKELGKEIVYVE